MWRLVQEGFGSVFEEHLKEHLKEHLNRRLRFLKGVRERLGGVFERAFEEHLEGGSRGNWRGVPDAFGSV
jgi:hypothetical protein